MKFKPNLLWLGVAILFLYACTDSLFLRPPDDTILQNSHIAAAYDDLDQIVDAVAELSAPPVSIDATEKQRIGQDVREAKKLIDTARDQVKEGATQSEEYDEGRAIIDDLNDDVAEALQQRDIDT